MDTIITTLIGSMLVYGYLNLINRNIQLIRAKNKVKLISSEKPTYLAFSVIIIIWIIMKAFNDFGNSNFIIWCCLSILHIFYTLFIYKNSKHIYIGDNYIIFSDCAKKSDFYSYRINEDKFELLPSKPPRKIQVFRIENDTDLLKDILKNYSSFE